MQKVRRPLLLQNCRVIIATPLRQLAEKQRVQISRENLRNTKQLYRAGSGRCVVSKIVCLTSVLEVSSCLRLVTVKVSLRFYEILLL